MRVAVNDITVGIAVQGETKFAKALRECQNTIKQLDSALKANAAEFDANADALGENVERTMLLKKSIETQEKMVEGLSDAIEYASKEYGEASAQTTKYVVAQNKAKESIAKLERELKDSDREMEELGRDSIKVGRQLESGIGDAAEETAKSLDEMYDQLKQEVSGIKGMMGINIIGDVAGTVMDAFSGVSAFAESTRDYRRKMSYVEQNAAEAGIDWALIKGQITEVTTITGDMEGAVEGVSNLLATGFDSAELVSAIDALGGAVIKFPETLKFESLADGLQETVATGSATGAYAELLERLGIDLDTFNAAMAQATTEEERQQIALSFLANHGLEATKKAWEENNAVLVKTGEADAKVQESYAKWGDLIDKYSPKIKEAWAGFLGDAALGVDMALTEWGQHAEEEGSVWKGYAAWLAETWDTDVKTPMQEKAKGFATGLAADISEDWTQFKVDAKELGEGMAGAIDAAVPMVREAAANIATGAMEWLDQIELPDIVGWAQATQAYFEKQREESTKYAEMIDDATGYYEQLASINEELARADMAGDTQTAAKLEAQRTQLIADIASAAAEMDFTAEAEATGEEAADAIIEGLGDTLTEGEEGLQTEGANLSAAVANGVADNAQAAIDNTAAMVSSMQAEIDSFSTQNVIDQLDRMNNALNTGATPSLPKGWNLGSGGSGAAEQGNPAVISFNVNGARLATAMLPDINAAQGREIALNG